VQTYQPKTRWSKCDVVTDKVIAKEALLSKVEGLGHIGSWQNELLKGKVTWSDEMYNILGYKLGEVTPSREAFILALHPDERLEVKSTIEKAILTNVDTLTISSRIINSDDTIKYIKVEFFFERDQNNIAVIINGLIQNVTAAKLAENEREKLEAERKKIVSNLIQRTNDLEQFTYIVSHDLRAPVANIIGLAEALNNETLEENIKTKVAQAIAGSVSKLDATIRDLNHILKVKNDVHELKEPVELSLIVVDFIADSNLLILKNDFNIKTNFSAISELLTVKSYIRSIFYNLISNSIKYRRPDINPVIEIKSDKTDNKIILSFKDNGLGIDLNKRGNQVFGLYKRFHDHIEGKGMGLFMVKTQVEIMGGSISIKSEVNKGTEFIIEFNL